MRAKSQTRRHSFSRCRTPTRVYRPNRARFGPRPSGGTRDRRSGSSSPGPSEGASSRARPRRRASPDFLVAEGENDELDRGLARATRRRRARLRRRRRYRVASRRRTPKLFAPARRARVSPVEPRARRVFPARVLDRGVRKRALWRDSHPERPLSTPETRGARLRRNIPRLSRRLTNARERDTSTSRVRALDPPSRAPTTRVVDAPRARVTTRYHTLTARSRFPLPLAGFPLVLPTSGRARATPLLSR